MKGYAIPPMGACPNPYPLGWLDMMRVVRANLSPKQEEQLTAKCRWEQRVWPAVLWEYGVTADAD